MEPERVIISADGVGLEGLLAIPRGARGLVLFAHGTGSSRLSPRNTRVAAALRASGRFGTLLFDLLTAEEDLAYRTRFEIGLLTERLLAASRWALEAPSAAGLPLGYFGASTGAAAALRAAVVLGEQVGAIVSRGGRPDLAGDALAEVRAPTLLIVGGNDPAVLSLNREALSRVASRDKALEIVPGASHLFEEPGALDEVTRLTADWLDRHLGAAAG